MSNPRNKYLFESKKEQKVQKKSKCFMTFLSQMTDFHKNQIKKQFKQSMIFTSSAGQYINSPFTCNTILYFQIYNQFIKKYQIKEIVLFIVIMEYSSIDGYLEQNQIQQSLFDYIQKIQCQNLQQRSFQLQQDYIQHSLHSEMSQKDSQNQQSIYGSISEDSSQKAQKKQRKTKPIKKAKKQTEKRQVEPSSSNNRPSQNQNNKSVSNDQNKKQVKKGRPKKDKKPKIKKQKKKDKGEMNQSQEQNQIQAEDNSINFQQLYSECQQPRAIFISFFYQIGHKKGIIFNQTQRKQLIAGKNKIRDRIIDWKPEHQWKMEDQVDQKNSKILIKGEKTKINEALQKVKILKVYESKKKYNQNIYLTNFQQDHQKVKDYIYKTILETSFIFADQVTEQLYKIMVNIINIVYEYNQEGQEQKRQKKLQQYGHYVLDCRDLNQYIFFNFQFSLKKQFKLQEDIQIEIAEKNKNETDKAIIKANAKAITDSYNKKRKEPNFYAYLKKKAPYGNLMKFIGQKIHTAFNQKITNKKIFNKNQSMDFLKQ